MIVFSKKLRAKLRNYFRFLRFDKGQIIRIAPNGSKAPPPIQQASDSNAKETVLAVEEGTPKATASPCRRKRHPAAMKPDGI